MAQIVLSGESWNSFAGIMSCVYYDSKTRKVYSMNAGYRSPLAKDQPLTISERGGETVLIQGFMAGVDTLHLHSKFGNLPYKEIYKPALLFSEKGFRGYPLLQHLMKRK
ncbi:gamma-glutamyltransferase [Desulfobacula phenolica]|uniref:Gamma-glutamyltranspeptidase n=1 Tax=Desulfobacula phenolica TaxID=90732 RepID=A0A1H2E3Z8_9BACT|nr:gamma-glutamyltransferase [Desulfobacula phenolica]SDT89775.1 Gamma-glutamyltranspeptidase [Desulfobacula phenolica]